MLREVPGSFACHDVHWPTGGAAPANGSRFMLMHLALKRHSLRHQTN